MARHDLHGVIDSGERWVRTRVGNTTRWVKSHPKTTVGIGVGVLAIFWGLVFYNRKAIGRAVSTTLDTAVAAVLDKVLAAPLDMPIPPYALLPPGPPEVGPLKGDNTLDSLTERFRPKVSALQTELTAILAPHGITLKIGETKRTNLRQLYLWGIGRFYKASGRTAKVTNVRSVNSGAKHPRGEAVDFDYFIKGQYVGAVKNGTEIVKKAILPYYAALEKKYGVKWGGTWTNMPDVPHWEDA